MMSHDSAILLLHTLFLKQNVLCYYTGVPHMHNFHKNNSTNPTMMTSDFKLLADPDSQTRLEGIIMNYVPILDN